MTIIGRGKVLSFLIEAMRSIRSFAGPHWEYKHTGAYVDMTDKKPTEKCPTKHKMPLVKIVLQLLLL